MENYTYLKNKGLALTPVYPLIYEGDRFVKGKRPKVDKPAMAVGWTDMSVEDGDVLVMSNICQGKPFYAVRTGPQSYIIGVDTDTNIADNQGIARAIEFEEMCKATGTYTIKTPNGYHYYFKYDEEIPSTSICGYIDIQSKGKCLYAPNVKRVDGEYKVINEAPILPMTPEIKSFILNQPRQGATKTQKKKEPNNKQMVESPAATNNEKTTNISTKKEMEKYIDERNKARAIVSWNEFKRVCDHLEAGYFIGYNDWTRIGWAMANVGEDNNYKDEALKQYERLSELHCPEKYNKTITCSDIFDNVRADGGRLGWSHMKKCVNKDCNLYSFVDDLNEDYEALKGMSEFIDKYKDETVHTNNACNIVSEYIRKYKGDNVVFDNKAKSWICCNEQNIWISENGENSLYMTRIIKDLIGPMFKAQSKKYASMSRDEEDKDQRKILKGYSKVFEKYEIMFSTPNSVKGIIEFLKSNHQRDGFWDDCIDVNPNVFAFNNKVLIRETGEVRDIRPEDNISLNTGYPYPVRDEEIIEKVRTLIASTQRTKEESDFILRIFSEHLFGSNEEEKIYIHTGSGSNGKSIVNELMKKAMGKYYLNINPEVLTKPKRGQNETSELHDAKGKRMVVASEPDSGNDNALQARVIKPLTSDEITTRGLFKNPFTFIPQFRLDIQCNDIPSPSSNDDGFNRRIQIIEYPFKFTDDTTLINNEPELYKFKDVSLRSAIRLDTKYRDAMMWILMDTFQVIKDAPYIVPQSFAQATNKYLTDNNDVLCFMMEKTEKNEEKIEKNGKLISKHKVLVKDLFASFNTWMREKRQESKVKSIQMFSTRLKAAKYMVATYGNAKLSYVFDIILKDGDDEEAD